MKPERIGLTVIDFGLYAWSVILKPGLQAVQRIYAFADFTAASDFVAVIGEMAEDSAIFPQVWIGTAVAEAIPTLVEVTLADPDLKIEHLRLADDIEATFVAQKETAGVQ